MLTPTSKISLALLGLLLGILVACPSFAAPISDLTVDVRNHEGGHVGDNLIDGDRSTAWVGGGSGSGPGKWIEFFFPADVTLESIRIANGNQGKGQFDRFRRLTRGVILYPDETRQKFTLKPTPGEQTVKLQPKTVRTFRIIITGVAPGSDNKTVGKVAVSEITVFGEMGEGGEPAEAEKISETAKPAVEKKPAAKPEKPAAKPVQKKAAPKPAPAKPVVSKKPEPAPMKKAEAKPTVVPKKVEPKPVAKKAEPKPAPKPKAKPKSAPKAKPKAQAKPKHKPKKKAVAKPKAAPKKITALRPAVSIDPNKPLDIGVISPWLDLELVAKIKMYFAHLTNLSDSYPDLFAASVRERERAEFLKLQAKMREQKQFGRHHIAMLEHIGLNFDKPEESPDAATVRVHGPYRYYIQDEAFEFMVDTRISLVRENGVWLISDVRDK